MAKGLTREFKKTVCSGCLDCDAKPVGKEHYSYKCNSEYKGKNGGCANFRGRK